MRRLILFSVAVLAVSLCAGAASPKFTRAGAAVIGMNLRVSFTVDRVWENTITRNAVTADVAASYVCVGSHGAADQRYVSDRVTVEQEFSSRDTTKVRGSLLLQPPDRGIFTCAPGERVVLACVSYSNIEVRDDSNALSMPVRQSYFVLDPHYGRYCDLQ